MAHKFELRRRPVYLSYCGRIMRRLVVQGVYTSAEAVEWRGHMHRLLKRRPKKK